METCKSELGPHEPAQCCGLASCDERNYLYAGSFGEQNKTRFALQRPNFLNERSNFRCWPADEAEADSSGQSILAPRPSCSWPHPPVEIDSNLTRLRRGFDRWAVDCEQLRGMTGWTVPQGAVKVPLFLSLCRRCLISNLTIPPILGPIGCSLRSSFRVCHTNLSSFKAAS